MSNINKAQKLQEAIALLMDADNCISLEEYVVEYIDNWA